MLQGSAQLLLRTTSTGDFSAISLGSDLKNVSFGERTNLEESLYYRRRYNGQGKEKTDYNIFTVYKRDDIIGFCPFGIDVDIMGEHFEKSKGNTFRYWNKIRMGLKFSLEKNFTDSEDLLINYLSPEVYFSYLHLPFCARGDLTTKARKGSFMFFILASPLKKYLAYIKFNVGSTWIKPYFKQEDITFKKMENVSGISVEVEVNRNGYNHSLVESSRDVYRGVTLFGGPEYNLTLNRIFFNVGISVTTENH